MIFSRLHQIQSSTSNATDSLKWLFPVLFSAKKKIHNFLGLQYVVAWVVSTM